MRKKREISHTSLNFAIVVAALTAALNLLWIAYDLGRLFWSTGTSIAQGGTGGLVDWSMVRMYLIVETALIIATFSLLSRKIKGVIVSVIALMCVGVEYIWWFIWTRRIIEAAGLTEIPSLIPHAGNLYGATGWNLAILVIATALFAWEIKIIIGFLYSSRL